MIQSPTMIAKTQSATLGLDKRDRPGLDPSLAPSRGRRDLRSGACRLPLPRPSWWGFALLLIVPDMSMVGYLRGPRLGAIVYNVAHDLATGAAIAGVGLAIGSVPCRCRSDPRRPQRDGPDDGLRPEAPEFIQGHTPRPHRAQPLRPAEGLLSTPSLPRIRKTPPRPDCALPATGGPRRPDRMSSRLMSSACC